MSVCKLPFASFEVEGRALAKILDLSEISLKVAEIASTLGPADYDRFVELNQILAVIEFVDELLACIEDAAFAVATGMQAGDLAVFELDCDLRDLRAKAYATVRASRLFVNDIDLLDCDGRILSPLLAA